MIDDTIRRLEARIEKVAGDDEKAREELLALVRELREVLDRTARTHAADAEVIARRAAEAAETEEESSDLEESILEFQATHPRLVAAVRSVLRTLGQAGI